MKSLYKSKSVKILDIQDLNYNTKLFTLDINLSFKPGQFVMAGLLGFGESALSLPASNQLAIRKAGTVTKALHQLKTGDKIFIRGPYGKGSWPSAKKILIVAGGCGIISLRPLLTNKNNIIFYGVKSKKDLLFKDEHKNWPNLHISTEPKLITDLFDEIQLPKNLTAFLCGPPIMYKFVIQKLKALKIKNIYMSLERRMSCGIGVCQHCAIGDYYVCEHGPIFSLEQLKNQRF
ncbi:MAG: FAD/NAD(P)-binding protein [bacterium]